MVCRFIYFHCIVTLETLHVEYVDNTSGVIAFTIKLDYFFYSFWAIPSTTWRCSNSTIFHSSIWCLRKVINCLIANFLNITCIRLKLLYLVIYLINKGQFMCNFCSIIFFETSSTRNNFIAVSINSNILICCHLSRRTCTFSFDLNIILRFLNFNIVILGINHYIVISHCIVIFNPLVIASFPSLSNFFNVIIFFQSRWYCWRPCLFLIFSSFWWRTRIFL